MLNWVSRFSIFCFLDNSHYPSADNNFECILAAGSKRSVTLTPGNAFEALKDFYEEEPGWLFGHLGFEINNDQPFLLSDDSFPDGFFFSPEILLRLTKNELIVEISKGNAIDLYNSINETDLHFLPINNTAAIHPRLTKSEYISIIEKIRKHIKRGDCYELNFCQQFFSENTIIDPLSVFKKLQKFSPNPFSAFYKVNNNFCMCASPERFLKKTGQQLMSQPIKGTSKRDDDPYVDEANKRYLKASAKEKSENVMVVDLVRNDLSKICLEGTVFVEEIFGIYSFPQVHQMISTIKGLIPQDVHWTKALSATFPMGSMTGAPKKRVIELIKKYENKKRGLFSGSIGYITPYSDFDFNVVIRSIFYNKVSRYVSFWAGGGITFYSDPELEYEECMVKAKAMWEVLK